jgi:beta-barrel assembly-enhancing protease
MRGSTTKMSMEQSMSTRTAHRPLAVLALVAVFATQSVAQTRVNAPKNKYDPADDIKLGREAAAEVERQMPVLRDDRVSSYVEELGDRLVDTIPAELRHPEFQYSFKVVNLKEINAFALPGGPMYVNRGMIEAAKTEGEVVGVMAHEMAHVALRHGTAQASKAEKYQIGAVAGQILGAIIGGTAGAVVSQGSQFGIGVSFLRFGRAFEKDADILGAQMMARAGYDPIDMAHMFHTIEQQGGGGGPEWMSSHPNPGNRSAYITQEAQLLRVEHPVRDTADFTSVRNRLAGMPPARSSQEVAQAGRGGGDPGARGGTGGRLMTEVEPPSSHYRAYQGGNVFRVNVPDNWQELSTGDDSVWFAPEGAYGQGRSGQAVFTHGMQFGVARTRARSLEEATQQLVQSLAQGNQALQQASQPQRTRFGNRQGIAIQLRNQSDATGGDEVVSVYTTLLPDDTLLYGIGVAPQEEWRRYGPVFDRVVGTARVSQ